MVKVYFNPPKNIIKTEFKCGKNLGLIYDEDNLITIVWASPPKYEVIAQYETKVKESYKNLKLF